jgi:hypothetical protein
MRLISSGIVRSPLRSPASRCATGISSFAPTSGPLGETRLLVRDHHAAGLLGMAAAADAEVHVRPRQTKIGEEGIRHVRVVVLARMHDARLAPPAIRERMVERRDLHEVRTGGGDQVNVHSGNRLRF